MRTCLVNQTIGKHAYYGVLTVFSFLALLVAWIAEYQFGILPCSLCRYQQYIFVALLITSGMGVIGCARISASARFCLLLLISSCGAGLSIYHVGIENKWWIGPEHCTSSELSVHENDNGVHKSRLERLKNAPIVRCDQVNWRIFGVSSTIWTALIFVDLMAWIIWGRRVCTHFFK